MNRPPVILTHQKLAVPYDYPVAFTRGIFDPGNELLRDTVDRLAEKRRHRVLVCLDAGVAKVDPALPARITRYFKAHAATLELAGRIETVKGGESSKTDLNTMTRAIGWMAKRKLCRHSVVMVIGGGSLLDVMGLAASLVHRGLRVVRVPTTVVAQNDVGVGVKTGIDYLGAKNFLGTFAPPFAVLNDFDFLDVLPQRDWVAGIAEAFKVAMIKDRRFFRSLCAQAAALRRRDRAAMEKLVITCARLHLDHIRRGGDPFETGSARPLDFGHWSAHQLEVMSGYTLRHGEAVAIGLALDSFYAAAKGLLPRKELGALLTGLREAGLPIWHPLLGRRASDGSLAVLRGLETFREHLGGALTVTLPAPVGRRVEVHSLDHRTLTEGVAFLKAYAHSEASHNNHTGVSI
ncbi:MAG: 3-dehydroquinate synthase [bacterium]